jgi:FAD/FMN-containing dehydrogenase
MLPLDHFTKQVRGRVIAPGDADYDRARRVFSGAVDHRPAAIVRPADAIDVARVIALARDTGLELAVRGGGHSAAGYGVSEGGIVLDLRAMRSLAIDIEQRTAWAEGGLTAGEYTRAAGVHGLATGFGDTGSVGIGGITLSGGIGFLVRKHGLTIDDLLAADVVTAGGELVRADAVQRPDLFWAIRGGGGNFGVVTRLKFRLHEVGTITGGMLMLPATPDVVAACVAEADAAPDELSTIVTVLNAPPLPFVPAELHGRPVVMIQLAHAGALEEGRRVADRFRALATPVADMVRPMPYPEIYGPEDEDARQVATIRTQFADRIERPEAEAILQALEAASAPMAATQIRVLGGAMARVSADATAFAHRHSRILINVAAMYQRPEERSEHEAWVEGLAGALRQRDDGAYVGFLDDEGEERVRAAYPGSTWDRLAAIKGRYDPDNVFRLNQNVEPAGVAVAGRRATHRA